jgi:hypothetical protein
MDVDTISSICFAYMGPWGREAEVVEDLARRGLVRPTLADPRVGKRWQRDDVGARPMREP